VHWPSSKPWDTADPTVDTSLAYVLQCDCYRQTDQEQPKSSGRDPKSSGRVSVVWWIFCDYIAGALCGLLVNQVSEATRPVKKIVSLRVRLTVCSGVPGTTAIAAEFRLNRVASRMKRRIIDLIDIYLPMFTVEGSGLSSKPHPP